MSERFDLKRFVIKNVDILKKEKKRKKEDSGYRHLKTKLLFITVATAVIALVVVVALYNFIFRGRFANLVVDFMCDFVYAGYNDAYERALWTYRQVVRNYLSLYFLAGVRCNHRINCADGLMSTVFVTMFCGDQPRASSADAGKEISG